MKHLEMRIYEFLKKIIKNKIFNSSEGWERLGLFEYYKTKNTFKFSKERLQRIGTISSNQDDKNSLNKDKRQRTERSRSASSSSRSSSSSSSSSSASSASRSSSSSSSSSSKNHSNKNQQKKRSRLIN
jgi:hypothetical protein